MRNRPKLFGRFYPTNRGLRHTYIEHLYIFNTHLKTISHEEIIHSLSGESIQLFEDFMADKREFPMDYAVSKQHTALVLPIFVNSYQELKTKYATIFQYCTPLCKNTTVIWPRNENGNEVTSTFNYWYIQICEDKLSNAYEYTLPFVSRTLHKDSSFLSRIEISSFYYGDTIVYHDSLLAEVNYMFGLNRQTKQLYLFTKGIEINEVMEGESHTYENYILNQHSHCKTIGIGNENKVKFNEWVVPSNLLLINGYFSAEGNLMINARRVSQQLVEDDFNKRKNDPYASKEAYPYWSYWENGEICAIIYPKSSDKLVQHTNRILLNSEIAIDMQLDTVGLSVDNKVVKNDLEHSKFNISIRDIILLHYEYISGSIIIRSHTYLVEQGQLRETFKLHPL